jgi:hypothetical protein
LTEAQAENATFMAEHFPYADPPPAIPSDCKGPELSEAKLHRLLAKYEETKRKRPDLFPPTRCHHGHQRPESAEAYNTNGRRHKRQFSSE